MNGNETKKTVDTQRAETIVNWLKRLWSHYEGRHPDSGNQGRVSGDGFNLMAYEVQNFVMALSDFSPTVIDQAFNTHFLSSRWMPKVSDIRDLAILTQSKDAQADEYLAWDSFCKALRNESADGAMPRFRDNKITAILNELGGWKYLAQKKEGELQTFVRKEFLQRYKAINNQKTRQTLLEKSANVTGLLSGLRVDGRLEMK